MLRGSMTRRRIRGLLLPLAALALSACFQIDYGLTLERDLSGRADLDVTVDLEQMAYGVAYVERQMMGEEGPPTPEQVEAARSQIREQMDDGALREESLREEAAADLPEGIEVIDARQRRDATSVGVQLAFRFDHIERLQEMDVGPDAGGGSETRPFGSLQIVEQGSDLVLRNEPIDPLDQAERNAGMLDEGAAGLIDTMFREMRISFSIHAPFEIVEHNATRREGDRLFWIYDYDAMKSGESRDIYVRYRR